MQLSSGVTTRLITPNPAARQDHAELGSAGPPTHHARPGVTTCRARCPRA